MDIKCATCGEPWDTHHLRHDEIFETEAGTQLVYYKQDVEDWEKRCNELGYFVKSDGTLARGNTGFFNLSDKKPPKPPTPPQEKWEGKLTDFWREQFSKRGWVFGASLYSVLRCPCCKDNREHPDAETRRQCVATLGALNEGDDDAIAADNELALALAGDD